MINTTIRKKTVAEAVHSPEFFEVFLVDENPVDNLVHARIFQKASFSSKLYPFQRMEYVLDKIKKRVKWSIPLPGLMIVSIDFRNTLEFVKFYHQLQDIPGANEIKLVLMSCLADIKYFKPLTEANIDLTLLAKPLSKEKIIELIHLKSIIMPENTGHPNEVPVTKKAYSNEDITVYWQPHLCTHSGNCIRQLPQVFDIQKKPWINVKNERSEKIAATVKACPSGALSFEKNK